MDMMRIPLATVLFVGSVGVLWTMLHPPADLQSFLAGLDNVTSGIIAIASIVVLVYSIMLYSNMNLVK